MTGALDTLWELVFDIAERLPPDRWLLIGGQMVMLHGLAAGRTPTRASQDVDVLADLLTDSAGLARCVSALRELDLRPEADSSGRVYRFRRAADNATAWAADSRDRERHSGDAAFLVSLIDDPLAERARFAGSDRRRTATPPGACSSADSAACNMMLSLRRSPGHGATAGTSPEIFLDAIRGWKCTSVDCAKVDAFVYGMYSLYMSGSREKSVSDARRDLPAVIDAVRATHEPVWISRRGQRVAAVIGADQLEQLQALAEDMADILDAEAARAEMRETAEEPIPWEQVKADLGLS